MSTVILRSGGEPVAVLIRPTKKQIEEAHKMLKAVWPDDKVTVKEVK